MLSDPSLQDENELDDLNGLLFMDNFLELDMGKYTIKHLPGSERLYKLKMDRSARLMDAMASYRKEQRYCDVIFRLKESQHPAHKVVLASGSAYFAAMFSQPCRSEARTTEVIDFTSLVSCPLVMNMILDFIYTSQVQLNDKTVRIVSFCTFMPTIHILLGSQDSFYRATNRLDRSNSDYKRR